MTINSIYIEKIKKKLKNYQLVIVKLQFFAIINYLDVDAVFVSCTALRIVEVLQEVEDLIKKPVISSNQAIIWDSIRSVEIKSSIEGFGKLLLN